ncbi:MAG: YdcF family protein [Bacteroidetes bacterium]|nr:YdcF family protein [Bacteroidota bacterium]
MFFILSKLLSFLLMPITWILGVFIFSLFTKNTKRKKTSLKIGIVLLLFFSNPFFVNEAFLLWEISPTKLSELQEDFDVGIILTGVTNMLKSPRDRVYFNKGADRVIHAIQLYKMGKIKKILISGGSSSIIGPKIYEAKLLRKVLINSGIPNKAIIIETRSRNTRENALYSAETLKNAPPCPPELLGGDSLGKCTKYLLITSAFHMRRALGCFNKTDLDVTPFSVDFYSNDRMWKPGLIIVPNESALNRWSVLVHEIFGYVIYWVVGYI